MAPGVHFPGVMRLVWLWFAMWARAEDPASMPAWTRRVDAALDRLLENSAPAERDPEKDAEKRSVLGSPAAADPSRAESAVLNHAVAQPTTVDLAAVERILRNHGLPSDLLAVARAESAFDPEARSPKGAVGLWQLMPGTARQFGLAAEERTDPVRSTVAAARLLRYLYSRFDDWRLALAAYNAGEGAVERAIRQAGSRNFGEIARRGLLAQETLHYVPKVDAFRGHHIRTKPLAASRPVIVWARPQ